MAQTTKQLLRTALLNAPALARLSGVKLDTLRALLAGKRKDPHPKTRRRLAAALRGHAVTLESIADQLERAP